MKKIAKGKNVSKKLSDILIKEKSKRFRREVKKERKQKLQTEKGI